ncbi:MAG: NFACT family protein, partial [Clostridia bacterium]|nr:NFACT family protein [Clostridia bacterium]
DIVSVVSELKGKTATVLLNNCEGFSPLVCRELCFIGFTDVDAQNENCDLTVLKKMLQEVKDSILEKHTFTVLYENGMPKDFSFIDINQYGSLYEKKHLGTACELLDEFYSKRDRLARLNKQNSDLIKTVSNLISRANRRKNVRIKELEGTNDREKYRIYGELIKANIHNIKSGNTYCEVVNFYDENMSTVKIKLDPALSPASNAAKYFKDYKKSCTARQSLSQLIESDKKEIEYLDSVLYGLEDATCTADVAGIRDELVETGYIKVHKSAKRRNAQPKIEEHISLEGYKILVGHNNIQNDYITTRLSEKNDIWFHTKKIHGSHVVLKNGGKEISEETLKLCGMFAAKNSRAKDSSNVAVDYTPIKYVKKPAGARPGMVIYTTNKTLYVTPWEK